MACVVLVSACSSPGTAAAPGQLSPDATHAPDAPDAPDVSGSSGESAEPEEALRSSAQVATDPATPSSLAAEGWRVAQGLDGHFTLAFRTESGDLPRNREMTLDVLAFRGDAPVRDGRLNLRGWMPDHRHGLVQMPQIQAEPDGHFRVEGLLLHMRGKWQLFFDLAAQGQRDTILFEMEL